MINSAQITEFMDVIFINMWDKDSSRLVFCVGDHRNSQRSEERFCLC